MKTIEKPDYEIAREEAQALFDSLGLSAAISQPFANMKDGWQGIGYNVTIKTPNGRSLESQYSLGIGHVKLPKECPMVFSGGRDQQAMLQTWIRKPHANFTDKQLQLEVAVTLAKSQKLQPSAVEVLADACANAIEATESIYGEWCANLGYDEDSRKAESVYNACREPYPHVLAMIGIDNMRKFAEFHGRF